MKIYYDIVEDPGKKLLTLWSVSLSFSDLIWSQLKSSTYWYKRILTHSKDGPPLPDIISTEDGTIRPWLRCWSHLRFARWFPRRRISRCFDLVCMESAKVCDSKTRWHCPSESLQSLWHPVATLCGDVWNWVEGETGKVVKIRSQGGRHLHRLPSEMWSSFHFQDFDHVDIWEATTQSCP